MLDLDKNKVFNLDDLNGLDDKEAFKLNSKVLVEVNKLPAASIDFNQVLILFKTFF